MRGPTYVSPSANSYEGRRSTVRLDPTRRNRPNGALEGLYVHPFFRAVHDANAPCLKEDPETFFPRYAVDVEDARVVCADCPLTGMTGPCATYATDNDLVGVWGGTTEDERRLRARRIKRNAKESNA